MRHVAVFIILLVCLGGCDPAHSVRIATFNVAMGLEEPGQLGRVLAAGDDQRLQQLAAILQEVRPDIVLLNEFDFDPATDAAALFNDNYLAHGQDPIHYSYHFRAPVNTGMDSGLDLDGDGKTGGPGDAWGFGQFPGQYGMLLLSRYPLDPARSRSFRNFHWSALPGARRPINPDGSPFHPDEVWHQLRLSSKSHWDLAIDIDGRELHLLAHHPTPPVFDGPEDRNGLRNFDEIRFWLDYTQTGGADYIVDDEGVSGGIEPGASFVIAGDFNADPLDGDSVENAIGQLLHANWIDSDCFPLSTGAEEAALVQGGINAEQRGDPAADTSDFNDKFTGNLRLDYLLSSSGLPVTGCGVFWPARGEAGHEWVEVSDHRLVWLDISL
jgi:endonuclease/exonuclease/phosphatase family metal-dependent hydrolase